MMTMMMMMMVMMNGGDECGSQITRRRADRAFHELTQFTDEVLKEEERDGEMTQKHL